MENISIAAFLSILTFLAYGFFVLWLICNEIKKERKWKK